MLALDREVRLGNLLTGETMPEEARMYEAERLVALEKQGCRAKPGLWKTAEQATESVSVRIGVAGTPKTPGPEKTETVETIVVADTAAWTGGIVKTGPRSRAGLT